MLEQQEKNFYKLIQGDCFDILPTIESNSIDLIVTDPPYNIVNNRMTDIQLSNGRYARKELEFDKTQFPINDFIMLIQKILKDGGAFYIFCSDRQLGEYITAIEQNGLIYSNFLVWFARTGCPSVRKRAYQSHCQLIVFGHKEIEERYTFNFSMPVQMRNLLNFEGCVSFEYKGGNPGEYLGHPTQKPSKLIKKLILDSSHEGNCVVDPFLGVGTTMFACQELRRNCVGIEINSNYCDIIRKRCFGRQFLDREVEYSFSKG